MEHFRILLGQQKDAISKDIAEYQIEILKLEEQLEILKDQKTRANSELRAINKKLDKLI